MEICSDSDKSRKIYSISIVVTLMFYYYYYYTLIMTFYKAINEILLASCSFQVLEIFITFNPQSFLILSEGEGFLCFDTTSL